jgi:hypothetical protein
MTYRDRGMSDGEWSKDGTHMIYNWSKIARETGYTVDQVKMYGIAYCRTHPTQAILEEKGACD